MKKPKRIDKIKSKPTGPCLCECVWCGILFPAVPGSVVSCPECEKTIVAKETKETALVVYDKLSGPPKNLPPGRYTMIELTPPSEWRIH